MNLAIGLDNGFTSIDRDEYEIFPSLTRQIHVKRVCTQP